MATTISYNNFFKSIKESLGKKPEGIRFKVDEFWVSPFNTIEHNVGYFEEYGEVESWIKYKKSIRSKYSSLPYALLCNDTVYEKDFLDNLYTED